MPIPEFNQSGVLPKGLHRCSIKEFVDRFCYQIKNDNCYNFNPRIAYNEVLEQLFGLSIQNGSKSIIFGGSFITNKEYPDDIDCIVILPNYRCIPLKNEIVIVSDCKLDVVYAVEDNKKMIHNLMNMFAKNRLELDVGLIEVNLEEGFESSWSDFLYDENLTVLLKEREAYIYRHYIVGDKKKGVLVTIHGLNTDAKWNFDLAPIVSANNWIFAPFNYGNVKTSLISKPKTTEILNKFRDWINIVYKKYGMKPSILAHSFGTFIFAKYISGFNFRSPVQFENIIFAGSILNTDFDWITAFENECVYSMYNFISPNDPWVPHINEIKSLFKEKLYGTAGIHGFSQHHPRLFSETLEIFDHGNMLRTDVFESRILPFLSICKSFEKFNFFEYANQESIINCIKTNDDF